MNGNYRNSMVTACPLWTWTKMAVKTGAFAMPTQAQQNYAHAVPMNHLFSTDLKVSKTQATKQECIINRSARKEFELGNTCCNFCLQTFRTFWASSCWPIKEALEKQRLYPQTPLITNVALVHNQGYLPSASTCPCHPMSISMKSACTKVPVTSRRDFVKVIQKSFTYNPKKSPVLQSPFKS